VSPGNSAGTLTVNGNYTQGTSGRLNIELGGSTPGNGYDVLNVAGNATLSGELQADLINGFQLAGGATFDVLRANSINLNGLRMVGGQASRLRLSVVDVGGAQVLRLTATAPGVWVVDDGDEGFFATGGFTSVLGQGYQGDVSYAPGAGGEAAAWAFTGL